MAKIDIFASGTIEMADSRMPFISINLNHNPKNELTTAVSNEIKKVVKVREDDRFLE